MVKRQARGLEKKYVVSVLVQFSICVFRTTLLKIKYGHYGTVITVDLFQSSRRTARVPYGETCTTREWEPT